MFTILFHISIIFLLFFLRCELCVGAESDDFSNWTVRAFTAPDDLPNEVVRDAIMTHDGSVWLASWGGGIVIMDGTHKRILTTDDGLISNDVRILEEDHAGRVWVGTPNGISCIQNNRIFNFTSDSFPVQSLSDSISAIECIKNGEVWIGNGQAYLFAWIPSKNDDVMKGQWKFIHHFTEGWEPIIEDIKQNNEQEIWIAVNRFGLVHFRSSGDYQIIPWDQCPAEYDRVCRGFVFTPLNPLAFISRWTVLECTRGQIHAQHSSPFETTCVNWAFGKLFLGTEQGLYVLHDNHWLFCPLTSDKRKFHIESISFLRDESLWVGTRSGVYRITESSWIHQTPPSDRQMNQQFNSESLTCNEHNQLFCMDQHFTLWTYTNHNWTPVCTIKSDIGSAGEFDINVLSNRLVICSRQQFIEIDLAKNQIVKETVLPGNPHVGGDHPIFLPNPDDIWFTTNDLLKWDGKAFVPALPLPERGDKSVYCILETFPGEYWIGGRGWIGRWHQGTFLEPDIPKSFAIESNKIITSMQTDDGELWFSQLGVGLLRYKDNQWSQETLASGLKSSYILSLFQSSDGTIWAGDRNHGIMSFKDGRWIQYDYDDGVPVGPVISIVEDDQQRIWYGITHQGIYTFHPDRLAPAAEIVSAPDQLVPDARGVFSFKGYDAWNHTRRDELVYSWRIVNAKTKRIEKDWNPFSYETSALLPPLRPGEYTFEVVSQDTFRNTSVKPARADFVVNPYFWMTASFRIPVACTAFFAFLSLFFWWKHHNRIKKELHIEKMSFREFCEASQIGVFRLSSSFEIVDANSAMARIAGFPSREEMLNHPAPLQWENDFLYHQFLQSLAIRRKSAPIVVKGHQIETGKDFYVQLYGVIKENEIDMMALDLTKQKKLEKEIVLTSTKEQQKIGRDLHDGILQDLTGISYLMQLLAGNMEQRKSSDVRELETIVHLLDDARLKTRKISKGLSPLAIGKLGFHAALQDLSSSTQMLYKIPCVYTADLHITIDHEEAELQLYHIAHEAITNAAKHASARQIKLNLEHSGHHVILSVKDDGIGFREPDDHDGLGMQIMRYRANIISADLKIEKVNGRGTVVECRYPQQKNVLMPFQGDSKL